MSSTMTIVVAVVVVLAVVAIAVLVMVGMRQRRSHQLRERFGPEYERAVEETGDQRQAERLLQERMQRRQELPIRDLDPTARDRYVERWRAIQTQFVDDPRGAVVAADELVTAVMRDRGYPAETFEQQVADVSVDHAASVEEYRRGHEVLSDARGQAATDDLRQAMVRYRALFEDLVGTRATVSTAEAEPDRAPRREREVT
ncbi:MAG TPA: hypothetical protein VOB72_23215 [Candidatus Dormibacteraeota bacterium]|nr:hypothetical protein [Candidatus Dormibacteraeota bacterium]